MKYIIFLVLCINSFSQDIQALFATAQKQVVLIMAEDPEHKSTIRSNRELSYGSGFIIRADGLIATNNHVIRAAKKEFKDAIFKVGDYTGTRFNAKLVFEYSLKDIAFLKIEDKIFKGFPSSRVLDIGDSSKISVGDPVFFVGSPGGYFNSFHSGVVSGLNRASTAEGNVIYENMIQSNLNYAPGVSGSPMLNIEGEIIGINTLLISNPLVGGQIDLAIPSNILKRCLHDYDTYKESKLSILGIEVKLMTELYARKYGYANRFGVLVTHAHAGLPGKESGLRRHDRIVAVNGRTVYNSKILRGYLQEYPIGTKIKLKVYRKNRVIYMDIKLDDLDNFKPPKRFRKSRYYNFL